ncbi:MAG: tetratricopeptide repeat protein [Acidobacteria bacterium]|nr:tetratricopeptide repeat protein [Acidobacteriota bacterium]
MDKAIFSIVVVGFLISPSWGGAQQTKMLMPSEVQMTNRAGCARSPYRLADLAQTKTRAATTAPVNPFAEADRLFSFGEDAARDKQSLAVIEQALASNGNEYQWLWRAARAYYYVGDGASNNAKLPFFEKGMHVGQRAIAAQPNAVEGHFWLAANYGGISEEKGAFKALALVKKIRAEMETVLKLYDRFQDGGAYLALGEMDRQLPRLLGGNLKRAIERLEQGQRIAPHNLELWLALGQAYQEAGRKDDARRQFQEVLNRQINPAFPRAGRNAQDKARRLLAKL